MNEGYAEVKARLDEIAEAVADEDLPLDEALALYEEAVKLGNKVSNLIEADIAMQNEHADDEAEMNPAASAAPAAPAVAPTTADSIS